ncbi:unnamed protein product [Malus baccata var. baccata]
MCSDTREAGSSHYRTMTKQGKGIALLLVLTLYSGGNQKILQPTSSEIDTLPCASSPVKDTTPGWRKRTSREDATSTYETDKASEDKSFNLYDIPWCMLFANDILDRRRHASFMETIQQDITKSMRGILIDWLVKVSEEYKLVPDTLYLTVYLIDSFLWFIQLHFTEHDICQMLFIEIADVVVFFVLILLRKYEEICAPRVEEPCFMTDNTYSREHVLKMESQVLKYFGFQLFAPTTKTFLRRFLQAAQASYKANHLAELTLVDYSFLNFLPSVIAASAVFLSKWTLDQSSHPWNPILEHYTSYKPVDLKITVLALQELQLNTSGCPLSAVRMKYRHQKYKSVASLSSPELPEMLF